MARSELQTPEARSLYHPAMTEMPGSRPWRLAVANQKGGVGKTTTCLNLAAAIEDSSGSVVVYDADPQQSASEIAAGGQLPFEVRTALSAAELVSIGQVRGFDTILIDLPGNLDDTPVLGEVLAASDFGIIPVIPERAAIVPTQRTAQIIGDAGLPFKILCNLVDPLRGPAPIEQLRELLDRLGLPYFTSFIRRYVAHPQSQLDGVPVTAYRGDRSWRAAVDDVRRVQVELLIELGRLTERTPA
jgi:chromosome partitioning protein